MSLSKTEFLARNKRRFESVELPGGGTMRLRSLNRMELRDWPRYWTKPDGTPDPKKLDFSDDVLLAMCLIGDDEKPIFTPDEALSGVFNDLDGADVNALLRSMRNLCGLDGGKKAAKEVEDALKN